MGHTSYGNATAIAADKGTRMRVKSDVEYLRQIPLFAEVDPAHLQVLSFSTQRKKFADGRLLFKEGGKGTAAYMIISGKVDLYTGKRASRHHVAEAAEGALLGETAMVAATPYSLTAKADGKVVALEISRKVFFAVAEEFPGFAAHVMIALNERLEENLEDLKDVQERLNKAGSWSAL
jgi:CRP/FNR family cyclic AMP-dependent transcriptional regulator